MPRTVATMIILSLPAVGDEARPGIREIPGVRHYFSPASHVRRPGGSPVVVFDDVNIYLDEPSKPYYDSDIAMQPYHFLKMGKTGIFFDRVMTIANSKGILVFVSTSCLLLAKFLHGLNDGKKASAFKPVCDHDGFTCQEFGWTDEKRLAFLRLRAIQEKLIIQDDVLQLQAHEASLAYGKWMPECVNKQWEAFLPLAVSEETAD
jgi:hypothetical protein